MRLIALFTLALVTGLGGCAATVSRDAPATSAPSISTAASQQVFMEVAAAAGVGTNPDWDAFLEEWQTSMTAAASSKGARFALAKPGASPKGETAVLVRMTVNEFQYVSQAKRYAVGIFSGNASLDVDVEFIELPQGKSLGKRKFQTSSSAWQGVFAAMTPKQVEAVSKEIIGEIARK